MIAGDAMHALFNWLYEPVINAGQTLYAQQFNTPHAMQKCISRYYEHVEHKAARINGGTLTKRKAKSSNNCFVLLHGINNCQVL